jgi:hypothetical protein
MSARAIRLRRELKSLENEYENTIGLHEVYW